ncbi:hypothetical protein CC79DRAFT_1334101 [Sarocladium strictum]
MPYQQLDAPPSPCRATLLLEPDQTSDEAKCGWCASSQVWAACRPRSRDIIPAPSTDPVSSLATGHTEHSNLAWLASVT